MGTHPRSLEKACALIEGFEGIELEAYLDPVGVPTICAGITRYPGGAPVRMGDVCDARVCRSNLESLLAAEYVPAAECIPGWAALGPNRQAALLSFAWNLGAKFYGASGFETISRVLREGATRPEVYSQMSQALELYVKAGGRTLPGLVARRRREAAIWNTEDDGIMKLTALQDTCLKKAPIDSRYLSEAGKRAIGNGETVALSRIEEIPADGHAWATLNGSGERWAIYLPHWRRDAERASAAPSKQVDWSDFACPVGKYITVGEVLQYDARRKPKPGSAEEKSILAICAEFDAIREAWDGPLGVTSGYRPEPYNSQVGGVPNSYHVKGMALDVYPVGESLEKFYNWLIQRWSGGFGDGRQRGFIHIDTRSGGKFSARPGVRPAAVWNY